MATKAEIIEKLSQCGGLSYKDWILLLDSIYFDGELGNVYEPVKTKVLPNPEGNFSKFSIVGEGTYTQTTGPDIIVPVGSLGILDWDLTKWSLTSTVVLPLQQGVPVLNPTGSGLPTEKAVADYVTANTVSNEKLGIISYNVGDNIALDLSNSNFNDTSVWARGVLTSDGSVLIPWTQYHTKKYYPIVPGDYICNLQLGSNGMAVVLYDENFQVVKSYTSKPNSDWTITADVKGFIRFSKLASQATELDYCKTQQAYSGSLYDSDVVTKDYAKDNLISINEPKKIEKILQPKFFKNATRDMDYSAFIDIKLTGGTERDLKYPNGEWFDLFLTFMRIREFTTTPTTSTTVVQIAKRNPDTGQVGLNNISVSSCNYSVNLVDENEYIRVDLTPISNSGLSFSLLIDTSKITKGVDTGLDLGATLELNTRYLFLNKFSPPNTIENGIFFGHSVIEFENIPEVIGSDLGIPFRNAGVGGSMMTPHPDPIYRELSMCKIAEAIKKNDFTSQVNSINTIIPTVTAPRQRRLERTRSSLTTTDFSRVTMMGILHGTNDLTRDVEIGNLSLDNNDFNTFAGAINYTLDQILSTHRQIKPYFFTDIWRYVIVKVKNPVTGVDEDTLVDGDIFTNAIGLKGIDYVDAVIKMAKLNHVAVKDYQRESSFNKWSWPLWYADSTHENAIGAIQLGHQGSAFIKSYFTL